MVRCKYRYLAVAIDVLDSPPHAPFTVSQSQLYSSITNVVEKIHGDFGVASITTGFKVKYCNPYTKIILIRCRHGPHRFVSTVLPIIRTIGKTKVQLNIIYIGSTIMKSYKYIRNYQLAALERFWNQLKTDDDRIKFKEALLNIKVTAKG